VHDVINVAKAMRSSVIVKSVCVLIVLAVLLLLVYRRTNAETANSTSGVSLESAEKGSIIFIILSRVANQPTILSEMSLCVLTGLPVET